MVRDVSTSVGTWMIAEGYADLEMRAEPTWLENKHVSFRERAHVANDRRRKTN